MNEPVESPCIEVCELRKGDNTCRGCYRTLDEIARWGMMSASERRDIMRQLPQRRRTADASE